VIRLRAGIQRLAHNRLLTGSTGRTESNLPATLAIGKAVDSFAHTTRVLREIVLANVAHQVVQVPLNCETGHNMRKNIEYNIPSY
jgi:hypothetical protein